MHFAEFKIKNSGSTYHDLSVLNQELYVEWSRDLEPHGNTAGGIFNLVNSMS